jgi:predicted secreted protein
LLAVVVTTGCLGPPTTVSVRYDERAIGIEKGAVLRIEIGEYNESIGDQWYLVGKPNPAVLAEKGRVYDRDCDDPGCGGRLAWEFTATGPGTTSVTLRYCYRSQPAACDPGPTGRAPADPKTVTVTVR